MAFKTLQHLLNVGLKLLKLVSFMVAKTWKRKFADSRLFLDNMVMFFEDDDE